MKKLIPFALLGLAFCTVSCKEETAGDKIGKQIDAANDKAKEGAEKLNETLKGK